LKVPTRSVLKAVMHYNSISNRELKGYRLLGQARATSTASISNRELKGGIEAGADPAEGTKGISNRELKVNLVAHRP